MNTFKLKSNKETINKTPFYVNLKQDYKSLPNNKFAKLITSNSELVTTTEIFEGLTHIVNNTQNTSLNKKQLPHTFTSTVEKGELKGQRGVHYKLFLDVESKVSRETTETNLSKYNFISYNSFNHGVKDGHRYRIILDLDRAYSSEEFKYAKKQLIKMFPFVDEHSFESNRMMYLPSIYEGKRNPNVKHNKGVNFSLKELIITPTKIVKKPQNKVNTAVLAGGKYDKKKQGCAIQKAQDMFNEKSTHDACFCASVLLKSAGLELDEVMDVIGDYETAEHDGKISRDWNSINATPNDYYLENPSTYDLLKHYKYKPVPEEDKNVIKIDEYVSEVQDVIFEKLEKHKKILINSDANTGKTYMFLKHTEQNVIIIQPYSTLVTQSYKLAKKINPNSRVGKVKEKQRPNFNDNIIVTTYDGLQKFFSTEGQEWLKDSVYVVDEAHNITMSAAERYRLRAIKSVVTNERFAKKVVYLTATPIDDSNFEEFHTLTIQKKIRREKNLHVTKYDDRTQAVVDAITKTDKNKKHIIFIDNKKVNFQLEKIFTDLGHKCLVVNTDVMDNEKVIDFVETGELGDVDILITTRILSEGVRIKDDIDSIHILSMLGGESIHQFSERPSNNAIKNTIIYKKNFDSSSDRNTYSRKQHKKELIDYAGEIAEIRNTVLKAEILANKLIEQKSNKIEGLVNRKTLSKDDVAYKVLLADERDLVYFDSMADRFLINKEGINHILFEKRIKFDWKNTDLLVDFLLLKYNFTFSSDNVTYNDSKKNSKTKESMSTHKKLSKEELEYKFDGIINYIDDVITKHRFERTIEYVNDDVVDNILINKFIKKYNEINHAMDDPKTSLKLLKEFGINGTKTQQRFLESYKLTNTDDNDIIKNIKSKFEIGKSYTPLQIHNIIINVFKENKLTNTRWKQVNSKTYETSTFLKSIFEIKSTLTRKGNDVFRSYLIKGYDSFKNFTEIDLM